ncbi:MAG TPA: hypothetical protein VGA61_22390 [Anaerolineae bacterium]
MSLGDYLRLQRARHGGITPWDIEAATNLPKGLYRQIEQRYRAMGDDDSIKTLADFYGVPFEDLRWRLDWPRKGLSRSLVAAQRDQTPMTLYLWDGSHVTGVVRWWDLGAIGLAPENAPGELHIIQRHAVERWDPRVEPEGDENDDGENGD